MSDLTKSCMIDLTNKYIGKSAECLKDAGFEYSCTFAGHRTYKRENEDNYDLAMTEIKNDSELIYRMFLNCKE